MDLVFVPLGVLLWALMVVLVRGLQRLSPSQEQRP